LKSIYNLNNNFGQDKSKGLSLFFNCEYALVVSVNHDLLLAVLGAGHSHSKLL